MTKPLKILMVLHMPWERNFGGSRVQLEIAEEWRKMGHEVEKFDDRDAFPRASPSILATLTRPVLRRKQKRLCERTDIALILSTRTKEFTLHESRVGV